VLTGLELYYFERAGYFVRRGLLSPEEVAVCRDAAERIVERVRAGAYADARWSDEEHGDFWGVNHILHPAVRETALVGVLAHPGVCGVPEDLFPGEARYHLATLLVNPRRKPYRLAWHRDLGPDLNSPPDAQTAHLARWREHVQLNGALLEDESLWVVPGTHADPLLPEQRDALRSDPRGAVPGQVCVRLAPGDFVFYNANLLHKGANEECRPRLTLHCAFLSRRQPGQIYVPQPWLADPAFLDSLPSRLRPLFERFLLSSPS
jgi:hypothetical protein